MSATTPEPLVTNLSGMPHVSVDVDNENLLYTRPNSSPNTDRTILMRVPMTGGRHEEVMEGRFNGFGCPWSHGSRCVIGEVTPDKKEIVFTAMNSITGPGKELAKFRDPDADDLAWELSPGGQQVALFKPLEGRIRLLSLDKHNVQEINIKGGGQLRTLSWAADGNFAGLR